MLVPVAVKRFKVSAASRGLAAAFGATIAGAAMFALYPRFFAGPLSAVDPVLFPIWFSRIAEWQPVLPTSLVGAGRFLFWLGPPALAAPWAVRILWLARHDDEAPMWFFVALTLALFVGLTMRGLRFSPYAEIASLIPLISGIARIRHLIGERRALWTTIIRAFAVAATILGLPFAGAFIMTAASARDRNAPIDACRIAEIAPLLNDPNQLGGKRHVIVAALEVGPEIMYRTPHAVLATPMHRNAAGILSTYRLMTAADDASAKAIIDSRSVDLILLCPDSGERGFFASGNSEDTFYNRLMDAKLPTWIHALPLPDSLAKHFRLFAVRPNSK
jgi:hypothetical protein